MKAFAQAAGGEADEPGVPVLTGNDDHMGVRQGFQAQLGDRGGGHLPFEALAGAVGRLQQGGDVLRLGGIGGQEQVDAELRVAQAAGGVEPGGQAEGEVVGGKAGGPEGLSLRSTCGFQEGPEAGAGGVRDAGEAFPDDDPVLVLQGNDIRDGGDGSQVPIL